MKTEIQLHEIEKVKLSDLPSDSSIGFVIDNIKWYVIYDGKGFNAISINSTIYSGVKMPNSVWGQYKETGSLFKSICEFKKIDEIYSFDTRKELYKWLSQ